MHKQCIVYVDEAAKEGILQECKHKEKLNKRRSVLKQWQINTSDSEQPEIIVMKQCLPNMVLFQWLPIKFVPLRILKLSAFKFTIILICIKFMFKALRRFSLCTMSTEAALPSNKFEYLLIPTNLPIPPYYFYSTRINQYLYDYLIHHKIKNVAAFAVRPGVHRRKFYPLDKDNFEKEWLADYKWPDKSTRQTQSMLIANNNAFYDGQLEGPEETPVQLVPSLEQIYPIGSVCTVNLKQDKNMYFLYLRAEVRLQAEWASPREGTAISVVGGRVLKTEPLAQTTKDYDELLALYEKIKAITTVNLPDIDVKNEKSVAKVIELLTGYLCTLSYFSADKIYSIFKLTVLQDRLPILVKYYREYVNILETEWKGLSVQTTNETREKEAILTVYENMKRIIGNPGEQKFVDKIRLKLKEKLFPEQVRKLIEAELSAIETEGSHDISRKKHYVTLLTEYPFGVLAKEQFDIKKAKKILEEDHYGMQKLKRRILEFIAVSNLKGEFKSKVLLLYGPPGVGKTSIVKSIAKCLNRPYERISLGGEFDTAVVKGHRKTYIGAYPGKIWDSIYKSKVENPVILLDEIDKIVTRSGGASLQDAVMEILDPVQNYRFKDDFMDIEIDLSRVLFVCTANSLDTIFPPLLDRLERIEVAGYTTLEKQQIFSRYIIEQAKEENGLTGPVGQQISFTPEGVRSLIEGYCKEAGVRNLVRKTNKIFQKIALKYVQGLEYSKKIMPQHLREFLGLPVFHQARLFAKIPPAGVMIGLAYNNYGGSIMYIECVSQGKPKAASAEGSDASDKKEQQNLSSLIVTGNIHDVMKESVQLAYTYSKFVCSTLFNNFYLEQNDVHINFPQIEIGKDGPSAGIAITSAFISLATNTPLQREIAMTGEITLSGRVNPIGGVKEKTMGARREGITTLIFPEDNRKDVQELQAEIKEGMTFYFASHYFQVLQLVLGLKAEQNVRPLPQFTN